MSTIDTQKWYILINDENILICFVSIIWKWRPINGAIPSQFSLAIKTQIDGWGFKVQNLKMDFINGGILLFTAARLIRIKIINCLYSQNPFSNFWLRHLICCYRHCVYIGVLSLKKVQFNLKESILMAAKRCICAVKSSWCVIKSYSTPAIKSMVVGQIGSYR